MDTITMTWYLTVTQLMQPIFSLECKYVFGWAINLSIINMQSQASILGCTTCISQGVHYIYLILIIHPIRWKSTCLLLDWAIFYILTGRAIVVGILPMQGCLSMLDGLAKLVVHNFVLLMIPIYDTNGDTEIKPDSFGIPEAWYHISPCIKIMDTDPIVVPVTQHIVCTQ